MQTTETFTTNENTSDNEILGRIYGLIDREDLQDHQKVHFIRVFLEYAKETN